MPGGYPVDCELCGEAFRMDKNIPDLPAPNEEIGEFWNEEAQDSVLAHAQCGIDTGMDLA